MRTVNEKFEDSPQELKQAWREIKDNNPQLSNRDIAVALKVTEANLIISACGDNVLRLLPNWKYLLNSLPKLGMIRTLSRNDHAILPSFRRYKPAQLDLQCALFNNRKFYLNLRLSCWHDAFAIVEKTEKGLQHSLQIFDRSGTSIQNFYLSDQSNFNFYQKLIKKLSSPGQCISKIISALPVIEQLRSNSSQKRSRSCPE